MPAGFATLFLLALLVAGFADRVPFSLFIFYAGASAAAFLAYGMDKAAARKNGPRTRERTLHAFALAGGWPGALIAQSTLRHKSRKRPFLVLFWITVALNCAMLGAFLVFMR